MPNIRGLNGRLRFSLRFVLLLFIPIALLLGLANWLLYPPPLDVRITAEPFSLPRYDDLEGNLPLGAVVRFTNFSTSTVWYFGYPESPTSDAQQLVDGNWSWHVSSLNVDVAASKRTRHWTLLRPMESVTFLAGPISESATEIRVGVPFTSQRFAPTEVRWIYSRPIKIVKKGDDYFPEMKPETQQEEKVVPLTW